MVVRKGRRLMADDKAGYGKPPVHSRFVKGRSGNPKGRPKGAKNLATIFQAISRQRIAVTISGRVKYMTKIEACLHQLVNKAVGGDLKAVRELVYWCGLMEQSNDEVGNSGELDERDAAVMEGLLRRMQVPETPSPETKQKVQDRPISEWEEATRHAHVQK
jgi:hypothetical protein